MIQMVSRIHDLDYDLVNVLECWFVVRRGFAQVCSLLSALLTVYPIDLLILCSCIILPGKLLYA